MPARWSCPHCQRTFSRANQRHACGTGSRDEVLRGRSDEIVRTYGRIEAFAKSLGPIEIVARERYVLLRSARIFADLVIMTDGVRVAIHLTRKVADERFFKVVADHRMVTHVTKLLKEGEVAGIEPYLKEAYAASLAHLSR
jgi:hypothetical protein